MWLPAALPALVRYPSFSGMRCPANTCTCLLSSPRAGHNCLKAELVVTDAAWPLREKFLAAVRRRLAALPNRVAYYPGGCCGQAGRGARPRQPEAGCSSGAPLLGD